MAITGIENMSCGMNLELRPAAPHRNVVNIKAETKAHFVMCVSQKQRKSVGSEEIEFAVTSRTLLRGDLQGVVMSMPGIPTTAFRNVSFKAKAKDPHLPLLSLSAKVVKENGRNVLKFPKGDRDMNLQLEDLKVERCGKICETAWYHMVPVLSLGLRLEVSVLCSRFAGMVLTGAERWPA